MAFTPDGLEETQEAEEGVRVGVGSWEDCRDSNVQTELLSP